MKASVDYFVPGTKHVCRFCGVDIQKRFEIESGRFALMPLGNYCMWQLELDSGVRVSINSCRDCYRRFDHKNEKLCEETIEANLKTLEKLGDKRKSARETIGRAKVVLGKKHFYKGDREALNGQLK